MFDVSPCSGMIVASVIDPDPVRLFHDVCSANGVKPSLVQSPCRARSLVLVRRQAARVLRDAGLSLPEIGRIMNRHHTSVLGLLGPGMARRKYVPRALAAVAQTSEAA